MRFCLKVYLKAWTPLVIRQKPVSTLGVSQHMHKLTSLLICELSIASKRLQAWSIFSFFEKLALSQKNYVTPEGVASHNILSTALHCSFPSKFLCWPLFWVITNNVFIRHLRLLINNFSKDKHKRDYRKKLEEHQAWIKNTPYQSAKKPLMRELTNTPAKNNDWAISGMFFWSQTTSNCQQKKKKCLYLLTLL